MTDAEWWLTCNVPRPLIDYLKQQKFSPRKLRLFGCACCRRIWHLLADQRSRNAVAASERYADKEISRAELAVAQQEAMLGRQRFDEYVNPAENAAASVARASLVPGWIAELAIWAVSNRAVRGKGGDLHQLRAKAREEEERAQLILLRCVFGNPFLPVGADKPWLSTTVKEVAQAIYADRAFDRLPVLADALEDAGCTDADILGHCRGPGPHVRGCWVVDLLLGKS